MHFSVRCSLQERLAQREERLKSLTATIKAKEQARQEPGEFPLQYTFQRRTCFISLVSRPLTVFSSIILKNLELPGDEAKVL